MGTSLAAPSIDTSKENLLQTVMDLEPAILAFKANYDDLGEAAFDLKERAAILTVVDSEATRELANKLMREGATGKKQTETLCSPIKGVTNKLWKSFCGLENNLLGEFAAVRTRLEPMALAYDRKKEQERKAEEARLAEIAKREAEDAAIAEAERLQAEGHAQAAEAVLSRPVQAAPVYVAPAAKSSGEATVRPWEVTVVDLMELVKAVASGKAPLGALEASMSFLKKEANGRKELYDIPGTFAKETESLRIRAN